MENSEDEKGLGTREALHKLYREIEEVLLVFRKSQKSRKIPWFKDSLHPSSKYTSINWISVVLLVWSSLSLFLSHVVGPENYGGVYICEGIVILILIFLSVSLEIYNNYLRHNEIPRRVKAILRTLKVEAETIKWQHEHFPSLFMPVSPCITLQWTYRDGKLVNLPWALLVKDDIIFIRPGQRSPGYCETLDKSKDQHFLHAREIYAPSSQDEKKQMINNPRIRKPLRGCNYRLLETPYLSNLRIMLEQALDRPVTHINQERHILLNEIVQRIILPILGAIFYAVSLFKYFYLEIDYPIRLFLLAPIEGILPLLPITFCIFWNLLNYIEMARFQAFFNLTTKNQSKESITLEEDTENTHLETEQFKVQWSDILENSIKIFKGDPSIMCRSANILHVLGSVTALCCIDKKGILSWPNPTAEKVFFLHNNENVSPSSSLGNIGDLDAETFGTPLRKSTNESPTGGASIEVLDLTHNHHDPFKLHFDDHDWNKYLSNLKPLGLAILLNTCNIETQGLYTEFCAHISCESMHSENLIPVTNRRCLCELAKQIGFSEQAQKIFSLEQTLCTFRHLQPDTVRRDNKYARSLQMASSRLKFPFPHMFAVVVREASTGAMQLLSEGTADIVLDSCVEYWDGKDLSPMTARDRKCIIDFYQRTSLTAYCTAFAYRPLTKTPVPSSKSTYLELPSDLRHLYLAQRSPTPLNWDSKGVLEPYTGTPLYHFYSTDSLLYGCEYENEEMDPESCFQMQCNQVFIGMVSMQYQVLTDMVHLIEQLERACIRFVHFSKENELRSRVFSEKMGLESGWNCHISLLSDRSSNLENSRAMSFSAPSAINMDQSIVKFEKETESIKHCSDQSNVHENKDTSQEYTSGLNNQHTSHEWQSLSCLTDSTDQSAPIHFDMSNRAKLPRGIDKIRPHIELIDNVPLLVSLFTDCTPSTTREMLHIMQDYGEVICVMGSASNCDNTGIFMQADASIAVEPLYPQMCQKRPVISKTPSDCRSPIDLARELNSLASSLSVKREDQISIYHLIMEARHNVSLLWNAVQFWICCCGALSGVQLICSLALLPPPLSAGQVLWLVCIVVPLLSASLLSLPVNPDVMKIPAGKNHLIINSKVVLFIIWCYGLKFVPTMLIVSSFFGGVLSSHCKEICSMYECVCTFLHTPKFQVTNVTTVDGWIDNSWTIATARLIILLTIVVHLVVISIGFVHRNQLVFKRSPHHNKVWLLTAAVLITIQILYTIVSYNSCENKFKDEMEFSLPVWSTVLMSVSPLVIFLINELVKQQEIGVNMRFQKRARLDFGTKLGMNSPF